MDNDRRVELLGIKRIETITQQDFDHHQHADRDQNMSDRNENRVKASFDMRSNCILLIYFF
ncbi:hypothetical protein SDC9_107342 [bioreactor metagenome]|uniref:Uncharacterized protein n=1 Tax=bioreactor metagenome TaxID=1076179 RepID=A0A645B799_9ZZZZ